MKYQHLLYNRRDLNKLHEYIQHMAYETSDLKLLEIANLIIIFKHILNNWADLFCLISVVNSKWSSAIQVETEAYKVYNVQQEEAIQQHHANAEYEYDLDCRCHTLKNTPKYIYATKRK